MLSRTKSMVARTLPARRGDQPESFRPPHNEAGWDARVARSSRSIRPFGLSFEAARSLANVLSRSWFGAVQGSPTSCHGSGHAVRNRRSPHRPPTVRAPSESRRGLAPARPAPGRRSPRRGSRRTREGGPPAGQAPRVRLSIRRTTPARTSHPSTDSANVRKATGSGSIQPRPRSLFFFQPLLSRRR